MECHSCVAYGKGNELDTSPVSLEGRDEGGVLHGLGFNLGVAAEVPAESDLDDDECAQFLVEGGRVRGRGVGDPSRVDEVRCRSMAGDLELLYFVIGEYPFWDTAGCRRAFRIALCSGEDSLGVYEVL